MLKKRLLRLTRIHCDYLGPGALMLGNHIITIQFHCRVTLLAHNTFSSQSEKRHN